MTDKKQLSEDEVRHVAELAELNLTEKEVTKFSEQLSNVISYITELDEVDTSKTPETNQTTGLTNVYRPDKVKKSLTQEESLSQANKKKDGYFEVEGILEQD